jgi:hypothetical protein
MGSTQKLAITIGVLLAMYFGAAVLFVRQSRARVDGDSNPPPPPPCEQVIVKDDSPGRFKLVLKKSETLRMNVMGSTGASWDGSHHLNASRTVPGSSFRLTFTNAADLQVREMVRSMLDQLPTLHQPLPTSCD